jgi:hypothetical protein
MMKHSSIFIRRKKLTTNPDECRQNLVQLSNKKFIFKNGYKTALIVSIPSSVSYPNLKIGFVFEVPYLT